MSKPKKTETTAQTGHVLDDGTPQYYASHPEFTQDDGSGLKIRVRAALVGSVKEEYGRTSLLVSGTWMRVLEDYVTVCDMLAWNGYGARRAHAEKALKEKQ
jgi:hypothetical protein